MQVSVMDINGKQVSSVELPSDIFEANVNVGLMHQAVVMQAANARLGTHSTLTRAEVNRSKQKWFRQKGTGRARHGARTPNIFVGGGVSHGPRPRKYTKNMPKQMRRAAIRSALSALVRDGQLVVVDTLAANSGKTRDVRQMLKGLVGDNSALILLGGPNENLQRGLGNLPEAYYLRANYLNVRDLLKYDKVIMPLDALDVIQSIWGKEE